MSELQMWRDHQHYAVQPTSLCAVALVSLQSTKKLIRSLKSDIHILVNALFPQINMACCRWG